MIRSALMLSFVAAFLVPFLLWAAPALAEETPSNVTTITFENDYIVGYVSEEARQRHLEQVFADHPDVLNTFATLDAGLTALLEPVVVAANK